MFVILCLVVSISQVVVCFSCCFKCIVVLVPVVLVVLVLFVEFYAVYVYVVFVESFCPQLLFLFFCVYFILVVSRQFYDITVFGLVGCVCFFASVLVLFCLFAVYVCFTYSLTCYYFLLVSFMICIKFRDVFCNIVNCFLVYVFSYIYISILPFVGYVFFEFFPACICRIPYDAVQVYSFAVFMPQFRNYPVSLCCFVSCCDVILRSTFIPSVST